MTETKLFLELTRDVLYIDLHQAHQRERRAIPLEFLKLSLIQPVPIEMALLKTTESSNAVTAPDVLPSEAIFAFMAWLTTREEPSGPFGANHSTSPDAAELVGAFCDAQGFARPRDGVYPNNLRPYPQ